MALALQRWSTSLGKIIGHAWLKPLLTGVLSKGLKAATFCLAIAAAPLAAIFLSAAACFACSFFAALRQKLFNLVYSFSFCCCGQAESSMLRPLIWSLNREDAQIAH